MLSLALNVREGVVKHFAEGLRKGDCDIQFMPGVVAHPALVLQPEILEGSIEYNDWLFLVPGIAETVLNNLILLVSQTL